jgi:hypothetical protein
MRRSRSPPGTVLRTTPGQVVSSQASQAITFSDDGVVVEAALVAEKLGLSTDVFWREMKRGIVYSVVERGEGEDAGRVRLTFRYRSRSWVVTVDGVLPE